ncbi:MAG: fibronectin type III domain-containing protein [Desulfatitalea sp.]|nr:fibronectin type III domain-containing protein [Desulfatitalea sp.]
MALLTKNCASDGALRLSSLLAKNGIRAIFYFLNVDGKREGQDFNVLQGSNWPTFFGWPELCLSLPKLTTMNGIVFTQKKVQNYMHPKNELKKTVVLILASLLFFPSLLMAMDVIGVELEWDHSTDSRVVGYRIYVREDIEEYTFGYPNWEGTDNMGNIQGLDKYEAYFFVVRTIDIEGNESENSDEIYLPAHDDNP